MARGNRAVAVRPLPVYLPDPLRLMVEQYQNDMVLPSISFTIVQLLETHPAIASRIAEVYARASSGKE